MNAVAKIQPDVRVNDFVLKIANVNGTGSASANGLLMKAIFRMGVPVVGKNLFPSNIQGLPTWYEIRLTKDGYKSRAGTTEFMVAMNAETYDQDLAEVSPGGVLLYDDTWPRPEMHAREDITAIGVPLARMCNAEFDNARTRVLMKNMAYVGAVAALTGIDVEVIRGLVEEMFGTKAHLIEANMRAIQLGLDYIREKHAEPLNLRVEPMDKTAGHIMIDGNTAAGLGAVYAGATFGAWYPITPSTSLMDGYKAFCEKFRVDPETGEKNFCIIQAEDELASIGMAIGAGWNGARAFTPTSGPGISLMSEFIGFAYYGEVPVVLFDVQRAGPSTGLPTRTQQCDLTLAAYASHGDTKHICVYPADPRECFEMSVLSFDLAERFQAPVFFMTDLDIGMNDWMVEELDWDDSYVPDRGKVLSAEDLEAMDKYYRYEDRDGDHIPYRTIPGVHPKGAYFTRGSGHNWKGGYTEDSDEYKEVLDRLTRKWESAADAVPGPVIVECGKPTRRAIISIGGCDGAVREALDRFNAADQPLNYLRVRGFPFNSEIEAFMDAHDEIFVVEQNRDAQLRTLLINETAVDKTKLVPILDYAGMPANPEFIYDAITAHCETEEA
ncbi:MAG: 2-oxoacid:acceptor oxidoreductase subunit alpha [Maricaulis sp.]|uniref:2-oxoacid:acceptor oxidoreductase subunit alpha n=1 Tax=Maricaulis sp. TaxID=1486257 RepID=UPI001B232219|nr:2-oxoacid:acceptor oxidoreductase subunit alpha [Maricaulis sp.]MBO6730521.1 2-oxoacid:acceptor oxidoreductase subunit alpha [Maricaulis sp.]MBO6845964.1 2-oxoacid:acceptor oxidoreductase subunit alpha [Maricaulis sp.]MBO6876160.1 2-oxoacid:acceptor oxidoreductase subunit alpha [Maricaulis sp.]